MTRTNIVRADAWRGDKCRTNEIWQYDYGQVLKIEGMDLPAAYEVHFSNDLKTPAIVQIGNEDGVSIPDTLLETGRTIIAYIYLHTGDADGETVKTIAIPVVPRSGITDIPPTPAQQTAIEEAIEALNAAVEHADEVSDHVDEALDEAREIVEDIHDIVSDALEEAKDSGEFDGPKGDKGDTGEGVAPGGTPGQVLKKTGSEDFETGWADETVKDVQVAGTSVLRNGVANVPVADGTNVYGVVRVNNNETGGIKIQSGTLSTAKATEFEVKAGTQSRKPIVPEYQHASTFYGLAKAAGDTTQSQSDNTVGRYTDAAKAAIQTMLDVPSNAGMRAAIAAVNTMDIHICTSEEYDAETGVPTVQNPDEKTFYLVPGGEGNNMFVEWAYVDNAWERFGSADVKLEVATIEEVQAIIDDYDKSDEEDEGMVTNAYFAENPSDQYDKYFETEATAQEIINAFKAGKNVVVCLKVSEESKSWGITSDIYLELAAYQEAFEGDVSREPYDEQFSFTDGGVGDYISGLGLFNDAKTVNGKLRLQIYVD